MIGKTNAVNVGNIVSPTVEMVNISLLTNQSEHDDLLGAQVTVSYGESTEILDWIGSPITIRIPVDATYLISVSDVTGYKTPQQFSATAIGGNARTVTFVYNKIVFKRTVIRINQTITDPSTMITRIVDEGGIEAVRANSHRYVGAVNSITGKMDLRQLLDSDGTKYVDGTTANLTTIGIDVFMKLPQFYWKCVEYATDIWDFYVAYGAKPDDTYKTWDGKDLIGVYEGYRASGNVLCSISNVGSLTSTKYSVFKSLASNRGGGFSLVKWKHHCMMAMLYFAWYSNTNSQSVVGEGTSSHTKVTGETNALGMTDTVAGVNGDSMSINFWGLENWWGNKYECIDNVSILSNVWSVTEDDGTVRTIGVGPATGGYISKLLFGGMIDLIPTNANGSSSTGFCDYYSVSSQTERVVLRSGDGNYVQSGIMTTESYGDTSYSFAGIGSRLAYRGDYTIID
jgi:hypothetical protein